MIAPRARFLGRIGGVKLAGTLEEADLEVEVETGNGETNPIFFRMPVNVARRFASEVGRPIVLSLDPRSPEEVGRAGDFLAAPDAMAGHALREVGVVLGAREGEAPVEAAKRVAAELEQVSRDRYDATRALEELRREHAAMKAHFDAAAPEHNLLALLDLYEARKTEAEAALVQVGADMAAAAGDLPVRMPEAGTDAAKLLHANIMLKRERDAAVARAEKAEREARAEKAEREARIEDIDARIEELSPNGLTWSSLVAKELRRVRDSIRARSALAPVAEQPAPAPQPAAEPSDEELAAGAFDVWLSELDPGELSSVDQLSASSKRAWFAVARALRARLRPVVTEEMVRRAYEAFHTEPGYVLAPMRAALEAALGARGETPR